LGPWFSYLCLLVAGIIGVHHYAWLLHLSLKDKSNAGICACFHSGTSYPVFFITLDCCFPLLLHLLAISFLPSPLPLIFSCSTFCIIQFQMDLLSPFLWSQGLLYGSYHTNFNLSIRLSQKNSLQSTVA
jgi:hypothetical protein